MFNYMYNIAVDEEVTLFQSLIKACKVGISVDQGRVRVECVDEAGTTHFYEVKAGTGIVVYARQVNIVGELGSNGMFMVG